LSDENPNQSQARIFGNDSQDLPLDLSKTSTCVPFVHRSMSIDETPPSPVDLSIEPSHTYDRQISIDHLYEEPMILTQPKSEWHYRSMKDLAKNHIPLVSGEGPQRTPIRIKVSF
jgi:hypothetical protein